MINISCCEVLEASQLLSSEITYDGLMDKLMRILIEKAGAQKGLMIQKKSGQWKVEAEGILKKTGIEISVPADVSAYPESIINYVVNSKDELLIDNASAEEIYTHDQYIQNIKPMSIFCMPLLKQGTMNGILYLENNLVTGAFTSKEVNLLKLLSDQIIISIENASLYAKIEEAEGKYRQLLENMHDGVLIIQDEIIKYANKAIINLSGYPMEEIIGAKFTEFIVPEDVEMVRDNYYKRQAGESVIEEYEVRVFNKNQKKNLVFIVNPSTMSLNDKIATLVTVKDITARKATEEELKRHRHHLEELVEERTIELMEEIREHKRTQRILEEMATHDYLTGLPNRKYFLDRLYQSLKYAKAHSVMAGILFVDLDGFKKVNDTFGHDCGDAVLKIVAKRLLNCVRNGDMVSRWSGDEFLILLDNIEDMSCIPAVCRRIIDKVGKPFKLEEIEGVVTVVTASIGVSIFPMDGDNPDILIKKADTAMYQAKNKGKNSFIFSTCL